MQIVIPHYIIEDEIDGKRILKNLERCGRTCYKSEEKITPESAQEFLRSILASDHESVIEHEKVTVKLICDHITRHRIASYSQESIRYCDYSKQGSITIIDPLSFRGDPAKRHVWMKAMKSVEDVYNQLRNMGVSPQEARCVLPNSLKIVIVITYNLREWRHFFKLRCSKKAHPQMREITIPLLENFKRKIPILFDDIEAE